jgi:hypothetical protein
MVPTHHRQAAPLPYRRSFGVAAQHRAGGDAGELAETPGPWPGELAAELLVADDGPSAFRWTTLGRRLVALGARTNHAERVCLSSQRG